MSVGTFGDDDQYHSVYDGLTGFGPGGDGRSWAAKGGHPPLYCPNPRFQPNARGLYFCPCCGEKIRHHTYVSASEWAQQTVEPALAQAWDIIWPSLKTLIIWTGRAIAWMARPAFSRINRHRQEAGNAIVERHPAPDRPGIKSPAQESQERTIPEPSQPPDNPENDRPVTCTTSDGIHVINTSNGRDQCFVCGAGLAGKAADEQ